MSLLVFGCPFCTKPFQVDPNQAGQAVRCPSCGEGVTVPEAEPTPDPTSSIHASIETGPAANTPSQEPDVFDCPHCAGKFGVSVEMYGSQVACPHCTKSVEVQVPQSKSASTQPVSASQQAKRRRKKSDSSAKVPKRRAKPNSEPKSKNETKSNQPDVTSKVDPRWKETRERPKHSNTNSESKVDSKNDEPMSANDGQRDSAAPTEKKFEEVTAEVADRHSVQPPPQLGQAATAKPDRDDSTEAAEDADPKVFVPGNIDHLLPPAFNVLDPTRLGRLSRTDQVLLPDGSGGLQTADRRVVTIMHEGQEYQLVAMTPEQRRRRKIIHNIVTLIVGSLLLYLALKTLGAV